MKKKSSRLLALLLAGLMLLPALTACSETTNAEETEQTAQVTADSALAEEIVPEETEITRENTPDTLPADLDYNGETFMIYYSNGFNWTELIEGGEELTGEVVADAVIESNLSVADEL